MSKLVIAHRGYSEKYPDNSWRAIVSAFEEGADMCEIDLHMTRDKRVFVNHDYYANGFRIAELTLEELRQRIPDNPNFEELLNWAVSEKKRFLFEVKDRRLIDVLPEYLKDTNPDLFIVGSFDSVFLREFKRLIGLRTCLLLGSVLDSSHTLSILEDTGADFVLPAWEARHPYPDSLLSDDWISDINRRGFKVITWHEERPEVLRKLLEKDVYGICTNDPPLVRRLMDERTHRKDQ